MLWIIRNLSIHKYINDKASDIYKKGSLLYALGHAIDAIKSTQTAIVVEGYIDAIILHQFGQKNVVATMGTAFTDEQMDCLRALCDTIILWPDGDNAGKQSVTRHLPSLLEKGFRVELILTPDKDPDEVAIDGDLEKVVAKAMPAIPWVLNLILEEYDCHSFKIKTAALEEVMPILKSISNPIDRQVAEATVRKRLNI